MTVFGDGWSGAIARQAGTDLLHFVEIIASFICMGLFCLWMALCVFGFVGLIVDRNKKREPIDWEGEALGPDFELPGLTWLDPTLWILAFFIWPLLVANAIDKYLKRPK